MKLKLLLHVNELPHCLKKIDQQRSEINSLHVEIKQYQNRITRLQQRQRNINLGFGIISLIFIVFFYI